MSFLSMSRDYLSARKKLTPMNPEEEESIEGKIVIITGANSGIGKETAIELVSRGAIVIMACRNMDKSQAALNEIRKITKNGEIVLMKLDLCKLSSIKEFANQIISNFPHVNILINNAGFSEKSKILHKTPDGFETHMGVNHLGHFYLTILLLDHLAKGAPSRIVCVSSSVYQIADLDIDDLMLEKPRSSFGWGNYLPYSNSKLANMLCMKELALRLKGTNINVYSVCPGMVQTEFFRHDPWLKRQINKLTLSIVGFSAKEACLNVIYCALAKEIKSESGLMYRFKNNWKEADNSLDDKLSLKLFEKSLKLVGDEFQKPTCPIPFMKSKY